MIISLAFLLIGSALLYYGGDLLVNGSSSLARKFKIRPFVIGAVIVGFGTSAPEAFVSVIAQVKGSSGLSFGNIVGSSIANIGLILGLVAVIQPIAVDRQIVKWEYPFLFGVTVVMVSLSFGSTLLSWHAIVFLSLFVVFLVWSIWRGSTSGAEAGQSESGSVWPLALKIVIGIVLLVGGSELLVRGGVAIARSLGISELIIGTTMIAVGTSLPELAASCVAALKKEGGLALGNIMGSNVFNLLFVSGLALLVRPIPVDVDSHRILLPGLIIFTMLLFPALKSGRHVGRVAGGVLIASYALFMVFLFAFRQSS